MQGIFGWQVVDKKKRKFRWAESTPSINGFYSIDLILEILIMENVNLASEFRENRKCKKMADKLYIRREMAPLLIR
jgi:hypothetical protein